MKKSLRVLLSKKVLMLLIQIFVVTLALVMTVSTYAWYTSNTRVEAAQTTVRSAPGANTEIVAEQNPAYDTYMGQTGMDNADDAPYYVEKDLTVRFTPLSGSSAVQLNFVSIHIALAKGGSFDSSSDDDVIPSFTWRLFLHVDDDDDPATDDVLVEYAPDENGFAFRMVNEEREYIDVTEETTLTFPFRLIYLDENSYRSNRAGNYESVTPFSYSGYEYMRATFTVTFEIGVDILLAPPEP